MFTWLGQQKRIDHPLSADAWMPQSLGSKNGTTLKMVEPHPSGPSIQAPPITATARKEMAWMVLSAMKSLTAPPPCDSFLAVSTLFVGLAVVDEQDRHGTLNNRSFHVERSSEISKARHAPPVLHLLRQPFFRSHVRRRHGPGGPSTNTLAGPHLPQVPPGRWQKNTGSTPIGRRAFSRPKCARNAGFGGFSNNARQTSFQMSSSWHHLFWKSSNAFAKFFTDSPVARFLYCQPVTHCTKYVCKHKGRQ